MNKSTYVVLFISLLLFACKKEIIKLTDLPSKTLKGIAGTAWKITASSSVIDFGGGTVMEYELYSTFPSCYNDNIYSYLPNGTTSTDEGNTKCSDTDSQTSVNGNWQMSADLKKLVFTTTAPNAVGLTTLDCEVLELNSTTMILRYTTFYNGPTSVTTTTYTKVR